MISIRYNKELGNLLLEIEGRVNMSYHFESRIRYSEIDENGYLTLPGIMDYFQDCSTFHSEAVGQGMQTIRKRNRAWVLSSYQIVVKRYPKLGEKIITTTFPYEFRGFIGGRNFMMDTAEGERLAYANSIWSYIDTETGLPTKLKEEDIIGYENEEKLEMEYAPRKIVLPKVWQKEESFAVHKSHLDTNHHVNNGQYVQMAMEYLPTGFVVGQLRIEYKQQAKLGNVICPNISELEDKIFISLDDENEKPYAVMEFLRRK